ncbi:hypothetical protein AAFF_G00427040 [Aldrovandia affinis]|uniref:Uncharacterized protein n=1 Tax=Aldrovandia affinis TaxID=143900 RepID=A0AAD7S9H4_9TELE|nr:hypothetical protein AAFF_G00427040 [Aldrovandia affinis]
MTVECFHVAGTIAVSSTGTAVGTLSPVGPHRISGSAHIFRQAQELYSLVPPLTSRCHWWIWESVFGSGTKRTGR